MVTRVLAGLRACVMLVPLWVTVI